MTIHLIAIGGAVMHNLALALQHQGHRVSGSDDVVYDPARSRLLEAGILPASMGWDPERLHAGIDVVILGMHAKKDNPELLRALALGLKVMSFPEFVYSRSVDKLRLAVAGSHGKTTTTAMAMHAMRLAGVDFDYLVGAQIDGFEHMVRLSDAPILLVEADEYLSSPLDPTPKMMHYRPHVVVLTGLAWDHMNVYPTYGAYLEAFAAFFRGMESGSKLFYPAAEEPQMAALGALPGRIPPEVAPFLPYEGSIIGHVTHIQGTPMRFFGQHNLSNARAAALLCAQVGIAEDAFLQDLASFPGAGKRQQVLCQGPDRLAWLDFAHAPSKVAATVRAAKAQFPERKLVAGVELHTFSSLHPDFLPQYAHCMDGADVAFVYLDRHTLAQKNKAQIPDEVLLDAFQAPGLRIIRDAEALGTLVPELAGGPWADTNLLLMSSGHFGGWPLMQAVPRFMALDKGT